MPSPFPGMDPYLETPHLWPDVHHGLISQIQTALNPVLRPRYVARVELRVYVSDDDDPGRDVLIPDVPLIVPMLLDDEIVESRLEIRDVKSTALVTVIEVLSPTNKIRGARGRASFMEKRREIIASDAHWVEIDLLRSGVPSVTRPPLSASDYRVLVSRAGERKESRYWPVRVRQPLPVIGIPLRHPDADAPLDLQAVFDAVYEHGAYDLSIDYRRDPDPPLDAGDAEWADERLRQRKLRN